MDEATGLMQDRAGNSITVPINITVSNTVAIGNLALSESDRGTALGDNAYVSSALVGMWLWELIPLPIQQQLL